MLTLLLILIEKPTKITNKEVIKISHPLFHFNLLHGAEALHSNGSPFPPAAREIWQLFLNCSFPSGPLYALNAVSYGPCQIRHTVFSTSAVFFPPFFLFFSELPLTLYLASERNGGEVHAGVSIWSASPTWRWSDRQFNQAGKYGGR